MKTEYLSRFTLGKPTKVELGVEKKKYEYNFNNNCENKNLIPIKLSMSRFSQVALLFGYKGPLRGLKI